MVTTSPLRNRSASSDGLGSSRGLRRTNALVRRVGRHRTVTTLFQPAAPRKTVGPWKASPRADQPEAVYAIRAIAARADEDTPATQPAQAAVPATDIPPAPDRVGTPLAQAISQVPGARRASEPPTLGVPPAQRPAEAHESARVAEEGTDTSFTEDVWRRLKTIFNRHKEREEQEEIQSGVALGTAPGSLPTEIASESRVNAQIQQVEPVAGPPAQQVQRLAPESARGEVPERDERTRPRHSTDAPAPAGEPASPQAAGEQDRRPATAQEERVGLTPTHREEPALHRAAIEPGNDLPRPQPDVERGAPSPEVEGPPTLPAIPTVATPTPPPALAETVPLNRSSEPGALGARANEVKPVPRRGDQEPKPEPPPVVRFAPPPVDQAEGGERAGSRAAQQVAEATHAAESPEAPPDVPGSPREQAVPLEQAWAVQRMPGQPYPPLDRSTGAAPTVPPTPVPDMAAAAPRSAVAVRHLLEGVASAAPTQSSVELIPPRRPRPGEWAAQPERGGQVRGGPGPSETPQTRAAPLPEPQLVRTEIGPLPSDLWDLIGEPAPLPDTPPEPYPRAPVQAVSPPAERAPADIHVEGGRHTPGVEASHAPARPVAPAPVGHDRPPEAAPQPQIPSPTIQRLAATERPETATTGASPDGGLREEDASRAAVDIDSLARRVYREIKRRLATERERMRPR